ncbi:interferon regulatory factor 9 isoform X2 [Microcaecilia unicolor]|uniref:Interferon regulatory factor 9 isoform X2 n=1 Tax=Microcaecilia unicolor TaxID=1415580 RepID=A0A6P7WY69_9AMPH|nr:interferon regulatory factor 9 isoform X2 [Microcaecilia unicolor]
MASGRVRSTRKLKQWIIEQVESGKYPGLLWDDSGKTMFRIPWKHAGKQDFRHDEDAAIFKAWAIFKKKYKNGDKADPATWKTRLRCALNKSPEFQEISERSQLDISEPYKVYRIVPPTEQNIRHLPGCKGRKQNTKDEQMNPSYEEEVEAKASVTLDLHLLGLKSENESDISSCMSLEDSGIGSNGSSPSPRETKPYSMLITFYYGGQLVCSKMVESSDCRILPSSPSTGVDRIMVPGNMEQVFFPSTVSIADVKQRQSTEELLKFLEKGVMLASNPQGIFAQRSCQGRVFWTGPCAPLCGQPNKLERNKYVKLFDRNQFKKDVCLYHMVNDPTPEYQVTLCFGEEIATGHPMTDRLITLQVEQVSAKQLMDTYFLESKELNITASPVLRDVSPSSYLLLK